MYEREREGPKDRRGGWSIHLPRRLFNWAGLLVAGAGGLYLVFGYALPALFGLSLTNEDVAALRDSAEVRLARYDSVIALIAVRDTENDSLEAASGTLRLKVAADSARMDTLRRSTRWHIKYASALLDSLEGGLRLDTTATLIAVIDEQDGAIKACTSALTVCESQIAALNEIIANDSTRIRNDATTIDELRESSATLAATIEEFLEKTNDCKYGRTNLLLVRFCNPSPTWTFFGGMVGGVVLYAVVIDNGGGETVVVVETTAPPEDY